MTLRERIIEKRTIKVVKDSLKDKYLTKFLGELNSGNFNYVQTGSFINIYNVQCDFLIQSIKISRVGLVECKYYLYTDEGYEDFLEFLAEELA